MIDFPRLFGDDLDDGWRNRDRVDEVRALAQACTDGVPFLLAPVRIETRFVRAEVPVTGTPGPGPTAEVAARLAGAAAAAESIAARDYATVVRGASAKLRRQFKREVELPLVEAAAADIQALAAAVRAAAAFARELGEAPPSDAAAAEEAARRLPAALAASRAALTRVRSPYHRERLLTAFDAATSGAGEALAEVHAVARPAAELFAELRRTGSRARRLAFTDGGGDGETTDSGDTRAVTVPRGRLVDSARAHAALLADLDALDRAADELAAADPVEVHERFAAAGLADILDDALARCTDIALVPQDWQRRALDRVRDVTQRLAEALEPVRRTATGGGDALAATAAADADTRARLRRLDGAVSAMATDANGPGLTVADTPTRTVDQLRVRIFPDDVAVLTHEPRLTESERNSGVTFWREAAAGGADEPARRAAWRALCARHGSPRAAWIARRTEPSVPIAGPERLTAALAALRTLHRRLDESATRPGQRLESLAKAFQGAVEAADTGPLAPEALRRVRELAAGVRPKLAGLRVADPAAGWEPLLEQLRTLEEQVAAIAPGEPAKLPGEPAIGDLKAGAWTEPPRAGMLPGRFVVVTVSGGTVSHVVAGEDVDPDLTLGLDPRAENAADEAVHVAEDGTLAVGRSLRWMVDYDTAAAAGMAVTVPITADEARTGFDRVYVLGLAAGTDPQQSSAHLTDLLDNHHYGARGLALLPVATPTNSTDAATSAYRSTDDADRSFDVEQGPPLTAGGADPSDGWRLARALGLPAKVFDHVHHADRRDVGDALLANAALWPATAGYAVEELLGTVIGLDSRDRLRAFATANVLGRGPLPALRVGPQPYGVLVANAFTRYVPDGGDLRPVAAPGTLAPAQRQRRFEILLRDVLLTMYRDWHAASGRVEHAYSATAGSGAADRQSHVLAVLGLDATSVGYSQRFALNAGRRGAGIGPRSLHVGIPAGTAAAAEGNAGPFALLLRFADVASAAGNIPPGPLLDDGLIARAFADVYDRLDGSRGYEVRYLDTAVPVGGLVVAADLAARVDALLAATLERLARDASGAEADQPLLVLLLRHALLVEARDVALRILAQEGAVGEDLRARVGSGDLFAIAELGGRRRNVTRWSFLLARLSALSGAFGPPFPSGSGSLVGYLTAGPEKRMDDYLSRRGANPVFTGFAGSAAHQPMVQRLRDHADAVRRLGALPPERAERVTVEHVDTCSHRLDAWLLGLGVDRLTRMRATTPTGVHVGAFGWVDGLKPKPAPGPAPDVPAVLDTDPRSPVHDDRGNAGFVHAPSIDHAATAALLRAGYLAHGPRPGDTNRAENRMAVNLSSRRVRAALELLDGIGAGNDLGALLGYQFERDLHDAADRSNVVLDDLVAPLRRRFPSYAGMDGGAAIGDVERRHVVDGLRLLTTVREWLRVQGATPSGTLLGSLRAGGYALHPYGLTDAAGTALVPARTDTVRLDELLRAVDRLADTVDAVADLVLVEGMHQIVQGNHPRAAAVLSALGEGRVPPRPEVVDTPATGTLVSHRVLLHLDPTTDRPPGWTAPSARAEAEPTLNNWLGRLIGPPGMTRASVVDTDGNHVADVSLTALQVQPVDLLAALHGGLEDAVAELAVRVLDTQRPLDVRENEPAPALQLALDRHPDWPAEVRSLTETAALLECVATVVGHGRAATPSDYVLADTVTSAGTGPDAAELATRVDGATTALRGLGVRLLRLLSDGADGDPALLGGDLAKWVADHAGVYRGTASAGEHMTNLDALWLRRNDFRSALLDAMGFGITGVVLPTRWSSRDQVAHEWLDAAEAALVEVGSRLRAAAAAAGTGVESLLAVAKAVFTETTPVLPLFRPSNPAELAAALADPPTTEPDVAVGRWLAGASAVRENLAALTAVTTMADAFGCQVPSAVPIQLPARTGEPWLGESAPAGPGSKLSLVLLGTLAPDGPCAAIRVDAWDEVVPAAELTTGVALHYDQPDAVPPQCLLLAVPPARHGHWEWEDLLQTLHDTLELARVRAVEPAHLHDDVYGQLLPALIGDIAPYSELNPDPTTTGLSDHRVVLDFGAMQPPAP